MTQTHRIDNPTSSSRILTSIRALLSPQSSRPVRVPCNTRITPRIRGRLAHSLSKHSPAPKTCARARALTSIQRQQKWPGLKTQRSPRRDCASGRTSATSSRPGSWTVSRGVLRRWRSAGLRARTTSTLEGEFASPDTTPFSTSSAVDCGRVSEPVRGTGAGSS